MKTISFLIGISIRGPIVAGDYDVGAATISVAYPPTVALMGRVLHLPDWGGTVFTVSWKDENEQDAHSLMAKDFTRHLIIFKALSFINILLQPFKLVRIGHSDSRDMRTIGLHDTLFFAPSIDGVPTGDVNIGARGNFVSAAQPGDPAHNDFFGSTELARPHIGVNTLPTARRFLRCYELLEHGFYSEAFIISFSIMDAMVQDMLHRLLSENGMPTPETRNELLRGIKENRLRMFLGPLLQLTTGQTISALWEHADAALRWINKRRNDIAHGGYEASYSIAAQGIYGSIRILVALDAAKLIEASFPVEFFRHSKITAAWTSNPPEWIPCGPVAESMDFNS